MSFQTALRQAISNKTAFCIRSKNSDRDQVLKGGIVISKELNEILWFAVSGIYRGKGLGKALLEFAISKLNQQKSIVVQTFDESVSEGKAARQLYYNAGFTDFQKGTLNPAGLPTVIMQLTDY